MESYKIGDVILDYGFNEAEIVDIRHNYISESYYVVKYLNSGKVDSLRYIEIMKKKSKPVKCECGSDSVKSMNNFHSNWCPKFKDK